MKKAFRFKKVPVDKLRWRCDPKKLCFESTNELPRKMDRLREQ